MRFIANTKPIVDGLDLGIIQSNITKFYQKSCIVELTIEHDSLRVNTEASSIKSELIFKGSVSGEGQSHVFVDSLLFKNLMKTIESDTVDLELKDDGLTIYSGKSKFNLPQVISGDDLELARPTLYQYDDKILDVDKSGWEFIQDNQMYAIAMSFIHPVYTNVWLGEDGDVIVGDFDNSIFTHSAKVELGSTCLITDTIVNLLNTIPEDAKIIKLGRNYEIYVETDPFSYLCEFSPKYEDDEGIGDYNSGIILDLFNHTEDGIKINTASISKYIAQAELFTTKNDDTITVDVSGDTFTLINENVNCKIPIENPFGEFSIIFQIGFLKDAISHMDKEDIFISPLMQDDEIVGMIMWTEEMEVVLAGADEVS